jgi:hypothetical protein
MYYEDIGYEIKNGEFFSRGVDYGRTPQVIKESKKYILIWVKGHRAWSGVGQTLYYPAKYHILTKIKKGRYSDEFATDRMSYTKQTRKAVTEAVMKKWEELNAK